MRRFSLRHRALRGIAVLLSSLALAAVTALPANAGNSATATINILVRSVTVSPSSITYGNCVDNASNSTGSALVYPNGACNTAGKSIYVTNGPAAGHIDVQGADAIPSDSGTPWTLCSAGGIACTGADSNTPGADQFAESTNNGIGVTDLTTSPQCDLAFSPVGGDCSATAGQTSGPEVLDLHGPSTSSDSSTSFTTVVTWTAVP